MGSIITDPVGTETRPSIAIVGAGIGGLALSIGLARQNIPFTLYEAAPQFSVVGAGVGLGPNAIRAMNKIDRRLSTLYDGIKTGAKRPEKYNVMYDALCIEEGFGTKNGWSGKPVESKYYTRTSAHRKALLDCMVTLIPSSSVLFNKRAVKVTQDADKVSVNFSDGEVIKVDILIGADGIKGAARDGVLGEKYPGNIEPNYSHMYIYRAIVPFEAVEAVMPEHAGDAKVFYGNGHSFSFYPISKGKEMNYIALVHDRNLWSAEQWTVEVTKEEMMNDFEGADERVRKLIAYANPVRWALFHHPNTPIFYNKRICLIGDAAHATTPFQAAGGGQALESAMLMSHLLGKIKTSADIEPAFKVFDELRRPRTDKIISNSYESGLMYLYAFPEVGSDMQKIVDIANDRLPSVWTHDLDEELRVADARFVELVKQGEAM